MKRNNPDMAEIQLGASIARQVARSHVDKAVPLPFFLMPFGGQDGEVWLGDFGPGQRWPIAYTVIGPDGEGSGRVVFSAPFLVLDARNGFVLGVTVNELDVQAIALYRLGGT